MGQKTNNRILWHGNGLNAEGKAVAPVKAVAGGDGTDGLNEGELYICNSDSDPALFILTDAGNVVRIDGNGSDTYTREQINEKLNAKVDVAFFSRMFGLMDEEGGEIQVNDVETLASSIKAKLGFWTEQYLSAKGLNPDSGSEPGGATTLAALTDVSITTTPKDGQVLAFDATLNKWTPVDMEATAGIDEGELLQILTQKGYATQQWVTQQSYAKTSVRIKAGTGLTGGGTLAQDVTLSLATVGTAGTYTKVTVDAYGRVTGHGSLAAGDIPALAISKITGLQAALDAKMDAADFEELFEKVYVSGHGYAIRAKLALYTDSWMSAKGSNPDAGSVSAGLDEEQLAEYLTEHGYATQTWVKQQGYLTEGAEIDLSGYATQSWVNSQGFLKSVSVSDVTGLKAALDAKMDADDRADFLRFVDTVTTDSDTLYSAIGIRSFSGCYPDSLPEDYRLYNYGEGISFPVPNGMRFDMYVNHNSSSSLSTYKDNGVMFRTGFHNNTLNGWRMLLDDVNYNHYVTVLDNLTHAVASDYIQVGSARLRYDSANNALYVQKSDGTQCGFYATGFVSTKGANSDAGSEVAGVTELSELEDVTISSPSNGQALVYRNGVWKNEAIETGLTSVSWDDVTGKPTWIGSTKPTYTAAEVGALTQDTADGRYVRQNLGYIGNNADLDDYTGSGLYAVSASSYATIGNFPTESAYGYGTLVNLMFAEGRGVQWYIPDYNSPMAVRTAWTAGRWNDWHYLLTNRNYNSYTVTKTGGGASGTWGIGISGNAASATKLQTARTIWGKSFDGTESVSGDLRDVGSIIPLSGYYDLGTSSNYWNYIWAYRLSLIDNGTNYICSGNGDNATYNTYNIKIHSHWGIGITDNEDICRLVIDARTGGITMRGALSVGSYVQIGSARLYYDSGNNALYVQKSDGTACGFYATGFVSAKGANDGGASGDLTGVDSLTFTPGLNNRNLYLSADGMRIITTSSSGWGAGIAVYNNANTTKLGEVCGAYGGTNSFVYSYFGGPYNSPGMTILANKNVGIGTTRPTYKLHVSGTAYATGGFQNGSDIRYKHVLQDLALTVAQVAAAPSFLFRWTDGTADGVQAGTSAQYWQQVLPQVVTESAGRLSMQYDKAALAAAIATARAVETLDQRVTRLEKENARLRRRLRQHKINV